MVQKGLYLHFLDRELRENTSNFLKDEDYTLFVIYSLLMGHRIYALLTQIIESNADLRNTVQFLFELERYHLVTLLSKFDTLEELILDRQNIYRYDVDRYPFYFRDEIILDNHVMPLVITDSTTKFIYTQLKNNHRKEVLLDNCLDSNQLIDYVVTRKIESYQNEGLTISSFGGIIKELEGVGTLPNHISLVRKKICSELVSLHSLHYLQLTNACIIRNLPYIHKYDNVDPDGIYDYEIYKVILEPIFKGKSLELIKKQCVILGVSGKLHIIVDLLYSFVKKIYKKYSDLLLQYNKNIVSQIIVQDIVTARDSLGRKADMLPFTVDFVKEYIETLTQNMQLLFVDKEERQMKILLPVANMTEFKNILKVAQNYNLCNARKIIGNNTYHIFENEKVMIVIVKCEAGSLGAASATLTMVDAIITFGIDVIIFSGIAFGNYTKKEKEQNIGDILVSRQIWNYEAGKVNENKYISRGDKETATPWLLDRFENSTLDWEKSKIHFGLIASGEKLVNSEEFIKHIMDSEPELIGGEMEGSALIAVAKRYKKDWILVKSIADWGIGKNSDAQEMASKNVFEFVLNTIVNYAF